jgi:hypothetical protein
MAEKLPFEGPVQTLVYPSIGRAELGRLLRNHGYGAEAIEDDGRIGFQTLIATGFTAWLQTAHSIRPDEFAAIFLVVNFALPAAASAAVAQAMRWKTMYAHLDVSSQARTQMRLLTGHTVH